MCLHLADSLILMTHCHVELMGLHHRTSIPGSITHYLTRHQNVGHCLWLFFHPLLPIQLPSPDHSLCQTFICLSCFTSQFRQSSPVTESGILTHSLPSFSHHPLGDKTGLFLESGSHRVALAGLWFVRGQPALGLSDLSASASWVLRWKALMPCLATKEILKTQRAKRYKYDAVCPCVETPHSAHYHVQILCF